MKRSLAAIAVALAMSCLPAAADTPSDRGQRVPGSEIPKALVGHTFLGNVGLLQFPIRAYVGANKTFRMSVSVEYADEWDDYKKKTQVLDEEGTWWTQGDLVCMKFVKRLSGAQDCFQVYWHPEGLHFYFNECNTVSTDYCQTSKVAFIAKLEKGYQVLPPTPTQWILRCTAGCARE